MWTHLNTGLSKAQLQRGSLKTFSKQLHMDSTFFLVHTIPFTIAGTFGLWTIVSFDPCPRTMKANHGYLGLEDSLKDYLVHYRKGKWKYKYIYVYIYLSRTHANFSGQRVSCALYLFNYLFLERWQGRENERERNINVQSVASRTLPTGDLDHNSGMCPDWESNQQPFGSQASAQSIGPHQPGHLRTS